MLTLSVTDLASVFGGAAASTAGAALSPTDQEARVIPNCNPGITGWMPGFDNPCIQRPRPTFPSPTFPSPTFPVPLESPAV